MWKTVSYQNLYCIKMWYIFNNELSMTMSKTVYKTCTVSRHDTFSTVNCRWSCDSSWQNLHYIKAWYTFNCWLQPMTWKTAYETCTVSRHDTFSTVGCGWPVNVYQSGSVLQQAQLRQQTTTGAHLQVNTCDSQSHTNTTVYCHFARWTWISWQTCQLDVFAG